MRFTITGLLVSISPRGYQVSGELARIHPSPRGISAGFSSTDYSVPARESWTLIVPASEQSTSKGVVFHLAWTKYVGSGSSGTCHKCLPQHVSDLPEWSIRRRVGSRAQALIQTAKCRHRRCRPILAEFL